ncbi:hypothetical protein BN946_scf184579.g21 [Trametes cinnabarina]|uniref:Uncharacterized protein n=1 Tax=Pycnoporus cinnabarinus TaxID=5643 RepID=A0A060S882_PYCCI|nr:hypothetical protein BN946_scf184579.g21 [Trametes cinnabarina]
MSSAGKTFGTQSPPLEASGQEQPMGVSSVDGGKPQAVSDSSQRQGYFKDDGKHATATSERVSEEEKQEKIKKD